MYEQNNIHILHCTLIKKVISTETLVPTVIQVANMFLLIIKKITKIPFVNQTRGFRISP